jgi:nucleoside phosphorylase
MLLVVAALEEELKAGLALCRKKQKLPNRKISAWQAERNGNMIAFLRTGVGPKRAAASLQEALNTIPCSDILVVGYAGALDPGLKVGDLVAAARALAFSLDEDTHDWDHIRLDDRFNLANCDTLVEISKTVGLNACTGDVLTSPYVLGDPVHKSLLYEKFCASIVDMETAALAGVAASRSVPISCVRAVSDEAADSFLAPFSYDPSTRLPARAGKLASTGMAKTYWKWKKNTSVARESLGKLLEAYL